MTTLTADVGFAVALLLPAVMRRRNDGSASSQTRRHCLRSFAALGVHGTRPGHAYDAAMPPPVELLRFGGVSVNAPVLLRSC